MTASARATGNPGGPTAVARGAGTADAAVPVVRRTGFSLAPDGSYGACLADAGNGWFPERWTLDSTEPYTVPLPLEQPEEPGTEVVPLADGRVLIRRPAAERHELALLYPTGPGTGQVRLGSLRGPEVRLLPAPAAPGSRAALATAYDGTATGVWVVHGDGAPRQLAAVRGRCAGGAWLDRTGRMLALDRTDPDSGRTKAVAVDLRTGGCSPLLQITEDSDDRLLLADPDSGLLLVRSDAAGQPLLGWGVLGSRRPVRFPECLRAAGAVLTPFAARPGQTLTPQLCAVALLVTGGHRPSLAVWRPQDRRAAWLPVPDGWLPGTGVWTPRGVLRLPYACEHCPCGVAEYEAPADEVADAAATAAAVATAATGPVRPPGAAGGSSPGYRGGPATRLRAAGPGGALWEAVAGHGHGTGDAACPAFGPQHPAVTAPGYGPRAAVAAPERRPGEAAAGVRDAPGRSVTGRVVPLQKAPLPSALPSGGSSALSSTVSAATAATGTRVARCDC